MNRLIISMALCDVHALKSLSIYFLVDISSSAFADFQIRPITSDDIPHLLEIPSVNKSPWVQDDFEVAQFNRGFQRFLVEGEGFNLEFTSFRNNSSVPFGLNRIVAFILQTNLRNHVGVYRNGVSYERITLRFVPLSQMEKYE